ncbi:cation-translocating P-type ATPase [Patescibacteria group bacterium]|nr:cation-translocating P-type ATPase [Patescibacteria group bacterium]
MENLMLKIRDMHCATCAQKIEKIIGAIKGVLSITVNFPNESAAISYDEKIISEKTIIKAIEKIDYTPEKIELESEKLKKRKTELQKWIKRMIVCAILTLLILFGEIIIRKIDGFPTFLVNPIFFALTSLVIYFGVFEFCKIAYTNIIKFKNSKYLLSTVGLALLYIYALILTLIPNITPYVNRMIIHQSITFIVLATIAIRLLGLNIERKLKANIDNLVSLQPKKARVVRNGTEIEVDTNDIKAGEVIKVNAGETIPVDGIIIQGITKINEVMVTGSGPEEEKTVGSEVMAATINIQNTIAIKATQVGKNTTLSQIISLLNQTKKYQSKKEKFGEKANNIFTILILIVAAVTAFTWLYLGANTFVAIMTSTSILIIANTYIFEYATLNPINFGLEKLASRGILLKGGKTLEKLSRIDRVVFDKTGILTNGIPEITNVITKPGFNEKRFLILLGSLESASNHPFAEMIVEYCKNEKITFQKPYDCRYIEGQGIMGIIEGEEVVAGNLKLMEQSNVQMDSELKHAAEILSRNVRTPIFVAKSRILIGVIGVADTIKESAKEVAVNLNKQKIQMTIVSGDNEKITEHIANELRIKDIVADILQKEKIETIQAFQDKKEIVAFVGNGINDAPVLIQADIGISMNTGTDTELESSDMTCINDDLNKINSAINSANAIMKTIGNNFKISFLYHLIALPIAAGVFLPITGMLIHPVLAPLSVAASIALLKENNAKLRKSI